MQHAFHGGAFFKAIGEDFAHLERKQGIISADVLDAWFPPAPAIMARLHEHLEFLIKTSPPTHADGLRDAIALARHIPADSIVTGGGSSGLIFGCFPHIIAPGAKVLLPDPMYGEYSHYFENVAQAQVVRHRLDSAKSFKVDLDSLLAEIHSLQPEMLVIVNPNSPTGQFCERGAMLDFLQGIPKGTTVVIDETYIEYAGSHHSLESLAAVTENVMVIKSMSKVYALSGMRVGYLVATPEIARRLRRFIPPWPVSLPGQVAAVEALQGATYYEVCYQQTHVLREKTLLSLRELAGVEVFDSCTNFYLVKVKPGIAGKIAMLMQEQGIFIRQCDSMSGQFQDDFLRIAVKSSEENEKIIAAFTEALNRVNL